MAGSIHVTDFDLAGTLLCGQAFRWSLASDGWFEGVVGRQLWRLRQRDEHVDWQVCPQSAIRNPESEILHYLSLDRSLPSIFATFPEDQHLRDAVARHRGLRVLRQAPWETLASFIASSSKQIVQIRQIVAELSRRFGEPVANGHYAFPAVSVIARCTHQQLWDCKLGFRAKNLLAAARLIDSGKVRWAELPQLEFDHALAELDSLPGVGEKIALCTLLFACGFDEAFPIDVWVERALRRLYFPKRKRTSRALREFTRSHFGPHAGWAQQYLFFSERQRGR